MNHISTSKGYLVVDWGTSNFRLFKVDADGHLISKCEAPLGLLAVTDGNFAATLQRIIQESMPDSFDLPVIMAGMVGSASGWHSVDYVKTPASADSLYQHAYHFTLPWGLPAAIVPGVRHCGAQGTNDVMRGEEVQVLGLLNLINSRNCSAILPGTHAKHVVVREGLITEFSTFMTGELFSIINNHSILGTGSAEQDFDREAFELGVREGQTEQLTRVLFQTRTHKLFGRMKDESTQSYLSGLLIGNELQHISKSDVYIVGGPALSNSYITACKILEINATSVDGDRCFISGIHQIMNAWK